MKAALAVSTCRADEGMPQSFEAFKLLVLSVECWTLNIGRWTLSVERSLLSRRFRSLAGQRKGCRLKLSCAPQLPLARILI